MYRTFILLLFVLHLSLQTEGAQGFDSIWDLQQVDQSGQGIHPAIPSVTQEVSIAGVVLNDSTDYLPQFAPWGPPIWQVYIQSIDPPTAGIALFEGFFAGNFGADLHALHIEAGDIVEATGFIANNNGKVNMNTRHGAVALFDITIVQKGAGLPNPNLIPSIADCNYFDDTDTLPGIDQYRRAGGEKYQAQWCKLSNVRYVSGIWGNNQNITITDDSGETLTILLSEMGDFEGNLPPSGNFDVIGIFDQEDANADGDFHDGYRLWVKRTSDIQESEPSSSVENWSLY